MALSDSCFEFLDAFGKAARKLADEVHWYSAPNNPLRYGEEIDALRRACMKVKDESYDPEIGSQLLHLAAAVMRYHDTLPGIPEEIQRKAEMMGLVRLLQTNLDNEDASAVPSMIKHVTDETPFTIQATARLAKLLPKLSKATYDAVIKIMTDVGSATAKKMLGL